MKRQEYPRPYSMGLPLLIITYLVLCILIFATVSLVTADRNLREAKHSVVLQQQMTNAENAAEEQLALDRQADGHADGDKASYSYPVTDTQSLEVSWEWNGDLEITQWQVINSQEEEKEPGMQGLLLPED